MINRGSKIAEEIIRDIKRVEYFREYAERKRELKKYREMQKAENNEEKQVCQ